MRKNIPAYQSENMALFVRYIPDKEAFEFSTIDSALDFIMGKASLTLLTESSTQKTKLKF